MPYRHLLIDIRSMYDLRVLLYTKISCGQHSIYHIYNIMWTTQYISYISYIYGQHSIYHIYIYHGRRGRPSSIRRPIRALAAPSIPSIRTILNTIMANTVCLIDIRSMCEIQMHTLCMYMWIVVI